MAKYLTKAGEVTIAGLANDSTPRHAKLDTATHTMQTIDYAHHEVHAGSHYYVTYPFTLDATTDTRSVLIDTPNTTKWAHMIWNLTGSAITEVWVYEDTTLTSTDAITVFNNNRNSTDSATVALYNYGTIASSTDNGTLIWHQKSGSATNQSRGSMTTRNDEELILKQDAIYRIHFATETTGNFCNIKLEWYEHTDKT